MGDDLQNQMSNVRNGLLVDQREAVGEAPGSLREELMNSENNGIAIRLCP